MALQEIKKYGEEVLRIQAKPVDEITAEIRVLIEDMINTMRNANGVGLAAPQIGVSLRVVIVTFGIDKKAPEPKVLINPQIIWHGEKRDVLEEGCLSVPEITAEVSRWIKLQVRAKSPDGEDLEFELEGITSRIMQHELDHLDGLLFIDRLPIIKRDFIKRKLKKRLKKEHISA
jgi:peptide deformylase